MRCLIDEDIPLNEGVFGSLDLIIPTPSILHPPAGDNPARLPAVVGGNVEALQRMVDVLLGALGLAAGSQGSMNNFLLGRAAAAVHTYMTNTRIADPEARELRFPVRERRFQVRRGSNGAGAHPGGDRVIREIEFLEDLDVSLMCSRRNTRHYGQAGGEPGAAEPTNCCAKDPPRPYSNRAWCRSRFIPETS